MADRGVTPGKAIYVRAENDQRGDFMAKKIAPMTPVERAIWDMTNKHKTKETTDVDRFPKAKKLCQLATNDEGRFASALFIEIMREIGAGQATLDRFHEYYYTPSRLKERHIGLDLSIGHYEAESRFMLMYKLVSSEWCDQAWEWKSDRDKPDKKGHFRESADHANARTLVERNRLKEALLPYIAINTCYCVHDYRRMNKNFQGMVIPGLRSPLRTTIIDLKKLSTENKDWNNDVASQQFRIRVSRTPHKVYKAGEDPKAYLDGLSASVKVKVRVEPSGFESSDLAVGFDDFLALIKHQWESDWSKR